MCMLGRMDILVGKVIYYGNGFIVWNNKVVILINKV